MPSQDTVAARLERIVENGIRNIKLNKDLEVTYRNRPPAGVSTAQYAHETVLHDAEAYQQIRNTKIFG